MIKYFSASWCTPCQNMKKQFVEEDWEGVEMIDADNQRDEVEKYHIRSIPTFVKLDESGEEIDRVVGTISRSQFLEFKGE